MHYQSWDFQNKKPGLKVTRGQGNDQMSLASFQEKGWNEETESQRVCGQFGHKNNNEATTTDVCVCGARRK